MIVTSKLTIDLARKYFTQHIYATQDDSNTRAVAVTLLVDGQPWQVPGGVTGAVSFKKADKTSGLYDVLSDGVTPAVTFSSNVVTAILAPQVLTAAGDADVSIALYDSNLNRLGTFPFVVRVAKNPSAGQSVSSDYYYFTTLAAVNEAIGNLSELKTLSKDSLVVAINEIVAQGGGAISDEQVQAAINNYLDAHPIEPTPIDSTLTQEGQAADAKATGEAIRRVAEQSVTDEQIAEAVDKYLSQNPPQVAEKDPTVPDWAKEETKPSYSKSEVGLGNVDNVRQYSASNPPPYPVMSVNGKTGKVQLGATDVGARPSSWMPTAQEVGALPDTYVPPNQTAAQVGADPAGTAAAAVSAHNTSPDSHGDLRLELKAINDRLNAFFDSDDKTLDELSEIVAYITSNKALIDSITTSKVSVTDIINNLTTNVANKPLSAAQGVALKGLIDAVSNSLSNYQPKGDYALRSELPTVPTKVSQLENDTGYLTKHQDISGKLDADKLPEAVNTALAQAKESGEFDGEDGQRGTGLLAVTTAPASYTTAVGGITPKYRMAISTIKTQAGVTEVLLGDTVRYSYYHYPIDYLDASYAYFTERVSIRGATGAAGKTPVKGTDYFTEADKAEMMGELSHYTFKGKKVMFFGDSITYGSDQYVPKLIAYTGMVNVGNHAQNGAKLYHSASGMSTESATKDTVPGQVQLLLDNLGSYEVPDIIIVSAGTNGSTPSPDYDETQYTNEAGEYIDFASVDLHSYSGSMRWIYEKLNSCYPLAKIFFATPLQVWGGSARTYGDLKVRAECIRQNCHRLATPCIDAFIKSGIYGRYERSSANGRYLKDGLHLNANGAILLAKCYMREIANAMIDCADVPSINPANDPELAPPTPTYTNQVPLSIDTDGSVFNGVGYQNGYRISTSSGSASAETNSTISGFIPATNGDVIRVYGVDWYNASGSKNAIAAYDSSFTYIGSMYGAFKGTATYPCENPVVVNTYDVQATIRSAADMGKTVAYIRVNSLGQGVATDGANMIVTINEEIT